MFTRTTRLSSLAGAAVLAASLGAAAPASAKPAPSAFPTSMAGAPLYGTIDSYTNGPTVLGPMSCDPVNNPDAASAQKRWVASYWDESNDLDKLTADAVVSMWRNPAQAFKDVVDNTGRCAFRGSVRIAWDGQDPSTHALFTDGFSVSAVILKGRNVIAVDVADWNGDGEAGDPDQEAAAVAGALGLAARL